MQLQRDAEQRLQGYASAIRNGPTVDLSAQNLGDAGFVYIADTIAFNDRFLPPPLPAPMLSEPHSVVHKQAEIIDATTEPLRSFCLQLLRAQKCINCQSALVRRGTRTLAFLKTGAASVQLRVHWALAGPEACMRYAEAG